MLELEKDDIFRDVLEALQTGVYFVDLTKKILFWNQGAEKITGHLRQDVVGCFCRESSTAPNDGRRSILSEAAEAITAALREGKVGIDDISLRHRAGHRIFIRMRTVPIRNSHGTIIAAAQSFDESPVASDWDRRQTKLADYGCLDAVSGVLTREFLFDHLSEHLVTFTKHRVPFSILSIQVDELDRLRETYGQAVVRSVLQVAAQTLENSLRPTDFLGRIAENPFLVILTECGFADIEKTARRLKKMVNASEVKWWGDEWTVSASFGGAAARGGDTVESLLERAEKSLAESLAAGGNQITVAA